MPVLLALLPPLWPFLVASGSHSSPNLKHLGPQSSMLGLVCFYDQHALPGRIPKSISLAQIFLLCSTSQIFNCLLDRSPSQVRITNPPQALVPFPPWWTALPSTYLIYHRPVSQKPGSHPLLLTLLYSHFITWSYPSCLLTTSQGFSLFSTFTANPKFTPSFPLAGITRGASWVIFQTPGLLPSGCCVIVQEPM